MHFHLNLHPFIPSPSPYPPSLIPPPPPLPTPPFHPILSPQKQKTPSPHLLGLFQPHSLQNRRRYIAQNPILVPERPLRRGVCHDEGDFVGSVGCFGSALFVEHFFGVAVPGRG